MSYGKISGKNFQFLSGEGKLESQIFEELMDENFLNLMKIIKPQIQEAQ